MLVTYWCPDCDYKTNIRVNLDILIELNHSTPSHESRNEDLMDAIEVGKIFMQITATNEKIGNVFTQA